MFRTTLIAAQLVLAAVHQPAFAQVEATPAATPEASATVPTPWLAGALSLGTPLLFSAVSMSAVGLGAPLGFGAGHWYAGDPVRGALVGSVWPMQATSGGCPQVVAGIQVAAASRQRFLRPGECLWLTGFGLATMLTIRP